MRPVDAHIPAINGGSSSIRFALYRVCEPLKHRLYGKVDRFGLSDASLMSNDPTGNQRDRCVLAASDHKSAADFLFDWSEEPNSLRSVRALGCRVVRGMNPSVLELVAEGLLDESYCICSYASEHQPREIELIKAFRQRHPRLTQVACFDTPFHRDMPRVAKPLRNLSRYEAKGL